MIEHTIHSFVSEPKNSKQFQVLDVLKKQFVKSKLG